MERQDTYWTSKTHTGLQRVQQRTQATWLVRALGHDVHDAGLVNQVLCQQAMS